MADGGWRMADGRSREFRHPQSAIRHPSLPHCPAVDTTAMNLRVYKRTLLLQDTQCLLDMR